MARIIASKALDMSASRSLTLKLENVAPETYATVVRVMPISQVLTGWQLLFEPDPYRMVPVEVRVGITSFEFEYGNGRHVVQVTPSKTVPLGGIPGDIRAFSDDETNGPDYVVTGVNIHITHWPYTFRAFTPKMMAGDDLIYGSGEADTLLGFKGNDKLFGVGGYGDVLAGGLGDDTYYIDRDVPIVLERYGNGSDTVVMRYYELGVAADSYTLPANIENLVIKRYGTPIGVGNALDNRLCGNSLDNQLDGRGGADLLVGGGGDDSLRGGIGADTLRSGSGSDHLAWDTDDAIDGGTGVDTLFVAEADVQLDLAGRAGKSIVDIERIDLTRSGDNTLVLRAQDVLALSSSTDMLWVLGDAGDSVTLAGEFNDLGVFEGGFHKYQSGAAIVLLDPDIAATSATT
jgi:hypothetical protein